MFSAFPGGWPGVALLLLRAVVGATAVVQGAALLTVTNPTAGTWVTGVLSIIIGAALVVGFLTPGAGAIAGLGALALTLFWLSVPSPLVVDRLAAIFMMTDAAAIALLGPGAFSLDARLFGRREIVIHRESHSSRF